MTTNKNIKKLSLYRELLADLESLSYSSGNDISMALHRNCQMLENRVLNTTIYEAVLTEDLKKLFIEAVMIYYNELYITGTGTEELAYVLRKQNESINKIIEKIKELMKELAAVNKPVAKEGKVK